MFTGNCRRIGHKNKNTDYKAREKHNKLMLVSLSRALPSWFWYVFLSFFSGRTHSSCRSCVHSRSTCWHSLGLGLGWATRTLIKSLWRYSNVHTLYVGAAALWMVPCSDCMLLVLVLGMPRYMTDMRTNCPIIELIKYERFGHKKVGRRKC